MRTSTSRRRSFPAPGRAMFLLIVENTGNIEGAYTAVITGTSGPVTAHLVGLDGLPTQSISEFRLPGLSSGTILLQADLAALGQGTVTVQVKSLSDAGMTATATATVTARRGGRGYVDAATRHTEPCDARPAGDLHGHRHHRGRRSRGRDGHIHH